MNFEELILRIDNVVYQYRQTHLRDIDILVLRESLNQKSYEQIAAEHNYTGQYLRQDVGPKLWSTLSAALNIKVSKKSCVTILPQRFPAYDACPLPPQTEEPALSRETSPRVASVHETTAIDWGDMADSPIFWGRAAELVQLKTWMQSHTTRLLLLVGTGGIGKTTLALKMTEMLQSEFDVVIVRSLGNAPPLSETLRQFFDFFGLESNRTSLDIHDAIQQFIAILTQSRCLIVLDNLEILLEGQDGAGHFHPDYQAYGVLLQQIAEHPHHSCVIVTTRDCPQGIGVWEGNDTPVKILRLAGLQLEDAELMVRQQGLRQIDLPSLQTLLSHYGGHPLALKMVAASILELADEDLSIRDPLSIRGPLWERGRLPFDDIDDLLDREFQRLNIIERQVMYWLALHRAPISLAQLEQDILRLNSRRQLPTAVQSLSRRSFVERSQGRILLQPVVMEYVTQRFIDSLLEDVIQGHYVQLQTYALLNAAAKDEIRRAQQRFVLAPLLAGLLDQFESVDRVRLHFIRLINRLRVETPRQPSYACGNILNLLRQLDGSLRDLDCSHLSVWNADLVDMSIQNVDFSRADLTRSVFSRVLSLPLSVCFSPNGQLLMMGNADHNIRVWTVEDYREHKIYQGHEHWVSAVTFCPENQLFFSGSFDQTIKLWDLETGHCLNTLRGHTGWIWSIVCSPHEPIIASCSDDHTIRIWHRHTGECLQVLEEENASIWALAFSPDGMCLASASSNLAAPVTLWNWQTGESQTLLPAHLSRQIRAIAFSPDGRWLATGSLGCLAEIWDVSTGACLQQLRGHSQSVTTVAFAPPINTETPTASMILATGSQDGTVRLWNPETGKVRHLLNGDPTGILSLAFHPRLPLLVSGSHDGTVRFWNIQTGKSIRALHGYRLGMKAIAIRPDGAQLASAGDNALIYLWDGLTRAKQKTLSGHLSSIWTMAFTSDSQFLLSAGNDPGINVWDRSTGEVIRTLIGHQSVIFALALSPDDAWLASASDDHSVRLWDVRTGQCLDRLAQTGRVWSVAVSPDGGLIACGHGETSMSLWSTETRTLIETVEAHSSLVWAIAFSPDGTWMASGSDDTTAKIWDQTTRRGCQTLVGHQGSIWAIAFSPDSGTIATGSNDKTIRLWEVESGQLLQTFYGHESTIWDVAFRGETELMSASQDGTLKVWDVATGTCTQTLHDTRPYDGMNVTDATGLSDAQRLSLAALGAMV